LIRYPVTEAQLRRLIEEEKPGWLARAASRTEEFRRLGRYEESSSIWSEVKPVYMRLQGDCKCAFCEREMESVDFGKGEQDVEHFRPKGSVKAWKVPRRLKDQGVSVAAAPPAGNGYHLLPYHIFNYAAACKPCNSVLKKDWFPIAGSYDLAAEDPAALRTERAYLIYPIGSIDDDPEDLMDFHGTSPRAVAATGHARQRALVTIEFFKLDDPIKRKNLYRDRALVIMGLYRLLEETTTGSAAKRKAAKKTLSGFLKPKLRHLNCARSFTRLFESNPAEASALYDAAVKLISTGS
jgi:hypothetical protein